MPAAHGSTPRGGTSDGAHGVSAVSRNAVHGLGLARSSGDPPPPFVRFELKRADAFMMWVSVPPVDLDTVSAAMSAPGTRALGAARVLADVFGHDLTPDEDALLTRYEAHDTGADFWAAVAAAGLAYTAPTEEYPPVSARTKALALRLGFVAIENTIARSPLILAADLRSGAGRPASAAQKAITAVFVKNFAAARCPTSGTVEASFAEISDLLGYGDRGGWQYEHIRDLIRGLRGAGVGGEWVTHDGDTTDEWYGIIQASQVTTRGAGSVTVRLGYEFQASIRAARFTYLENEQVRRLNQASSRSDTPLNFWYFLQSQRLPWPLGWPIFRAPEGVTQPPAGVRPLAEILGLHGKNHRKTVQRIRAAAKIVMQVFPEYSITVKPTEIATMYRVFATRHGAVEEPAAPVDNSVVVVYEEGTAPCMSGGPPVYERGTAPCMSGVQAGVRAGYSETDKTPAPTLAYYGDTVFKSQSLRSSQESKEQATSPSSSDSSPSQTDRAEQSEYLEGDTIGPELARFDEFWTAYPRREQSHRRDAEKQFAKLSDADQDATIRAAGHVAATKPDPLFVSQPENFILKGRFKDWQDGPPAAHQSRNMSSADIMAMADAFDLLTCYVCRADLTPDEQADETLTTHDGLGWRHVGCDYDRAFLTD